MTLKQLHNHISTHVASLFAKIVSGIKIVFVCQQI